MLTHGLAYVNRLCGFCGMLFAHGARSPWVELSRPPDQRYGYASSGTGIECHSTSFQAPPSRRKINVVGAEMCCGVSFIV